MNIYRLQICVDESAFDENALFVTFATAFFNLDTHDEENTETLWEVN